MSKSDQIKILTKSVEKLVILSTDQKNEIESLRADMKYMQRELDEFKINVSRQKSKIQDFDSELQECKTEIENINSDFRNIKNSIQISEFNTEAKNRLHSFLVDESIREARDEKLTRTDISNGFNNYNNLKRRYISKK